MTELAALIIGLLAGYSIGQKNADKGPKSPSIQKLKRSSPTSPKRVKKSAYGGKIIQ